MNESTNTNENTNTDTNENTNGEPSTEVEQKTESESNCDNTNATADSSDGAPPISFKVTFKSQAFAIEMSPDKTVAALKELLAKKAGCEAEQIKLMFKGKLDDAKTLRESKLTNKAKAMMLVTDLAAAKRFKEAPKAETVAASVASSTSGGPGKCVRFRCCFGAAFWSEEKLCFAILFSGFLCLFVFLF